MKALPAIVLSFPSLAMAGSVAVCDGAVTDVVDILGKHTTNCSVAWRVIDEPVSSWLATLTVEQAGALAGSALLLWSVAYVFRLIRRAINENAL